MDLDSLLQFIGRFHPVVVHFPIALLLLAAGIELFRRGKKKPAEAAYVCLLVGAASAIVTAWLGWIYAEHDPPGRSVEEILFRHRWSGVATAVSAIFTAALAVAVKRSRRSGPVGLYHLGLALTAGLVAYGSHQGGTLVYGEGYLLEALQSAEDPPVDLVPEIPPEPGEPPAQETDYVAKVVPILTASCFKCHGPKGRPKAGLRLDDMADVFAGDPEDWVIRPGNASASLLYQRISLPPGHDDIMPAEGDPLTAEKIQVIADWIDAGAEWTEIAPVTGGDEPQETSAVDPSGLDAEQREARDAAIARIRAAGAYAARVALDADEAEANLGLLTEATTDASLSLLSGLEPALVHLDLSRSAITDAGLVTVARFERLESLRLDRTSIGDDGLAHLRGLGALEVLNLVDTNVTDAGLEHVRALPALKRLYVTGTPVTPAGVERFEQACPGVRVVR